MSEPSEIKESALPPKDTAPLLLFANGQCTHFNDLNMKVPDFVQKMAESPQLRTAEGRKKLGLIEIDETSDQYGMSRSIDVVYDATSGFFYAEMRNGRFLLWKMVFYPKDVPDFYKTFFLPMVQVNHLEDVGNAYKYEIENARKEKQTEMQ